VIYVERGGTTQEYLTPGTITKLYFDRDCYDLKESDTEGLDTMRAQVFVNILDSPKANYLTKTLPLPSVIDT
jgi:hypothetical protein